MTQERSTKTINDLIRFANGKMSANLDKLREEDSEILYARLFHLAGQFKSLCTEEFPGIWLDCNRRNLLPQSGFARLAVTTTEISHAFRPDWAIWLSVHEYLEKHGKELGL